MTDFPKRKPGRPARVKVDAAGLVGISAEEQIDKLTASLNVNIEQLRLKAETGALTKEEVGTLAKLSRILETCARAKKSLSDATREDGDLSAIPTEQLARIVVRAMRTDPALKAAIAGEIAKGADA